MSKDRMVSVHDPEMRHGHKSSSRRFDGHKAAIVVDTDTQLITAVEVLPGNAPDNLGALELVEQMLSLPKCNTGVQVQEAMGDVTYGDGGTRQAFADAGRKLVARVPGRPDRQRFPKDDFVIDLAAGSCTCPAGRLTHTIVPAGKRTDGKGRVNHLRAFQFDGSECMTCPLRSQCISTKGRKGRWVLIHPQEALLQQARALQQSAGYDEYRARRVVVEHRLARLVHLGIRQSRYFGRVKTKFQLYLAATVANLTLVAGKLGRPGRWRPNRPQRRPEYSPLCCRQCYRQFLRSPPRTTVARDSAHAGFTAQMSLPNENFPARFLVTTLAPETPPPGPMPTTTPSALAFKSLTPRGTPAAKPAITAPLPSHVPSRATSTQVPTAAAPTTTLVITIVPIPAGIPDYDRGDWKHWTDEDGDCQDIRHEALIIESLVEVTFKTHKECQATTGRWYGVFDGHHLENPDHMVPLKNARNSGGWAWSPAMKEEYANDLRAGDHLIVVQDRGNQAKGARGPDEWMPPDKSYWCQHATDWTEIKYWANLTMTEPEAEVVALMLGTCDDPPAVVREVESHWAPGTVTGSLSLRRRRSFRIRCTGRARKPQKRGSRGCREVSAKDRAFPRQRSRVQELETETETG